MLAQLTGVSHSTVREKLEKLQTENFSIETTHDREYRLKEKPESIHPALIRYHLKKTATNFDVLHFPLIDSTNSEAKRLAAKGDGGHASREGWLNARRKELQARMRRRRGRGRRILG